MTLPSLSTTSTVALVGEAWLVTDLPGARKLTVACLLAASMARRAHIEGDRLQEWIASGAVWPGQEPAGEGGRQIALNRRNRAPDGTVAEIVARANASRLPARMLPIAGQHPDLK